VWATKIAELDQRPIAEVEKMISLLGRGVRIGVGQQILTEPSQ